MITQPYGILTNPAYVDGQEDAVPDVLPTIAPQPAQQGQLEPIRAPQAAQQQPAPIFQPNQDRRAREKTLEDHISAVRQPAHGFWGKTGRVLETIGNVAGDILAPQTMSLIPGTQLHGELEKGREKRELSQLQGEDLEDQKEFEQEQNNASKRTLEGSQAKNLDAEAELNATKAKSPDLAAAYAHRVNEVIAQGGDPSQDPVVQHLADAITSIQKQPVAKTPSAKEGLQQQLVDAENKGDTATVKKLQQQLKDIDPMGETRIGLTVRGQDLAAGARDQKGDAATRQAAFKSFQPALDSGERFNVMAKNYEDAVKNHDQQAMLSLLANHLGMTMGLQKGSRLTRDIIHEAEQSRPWLQGMAAKFDKDGVLSGVTLTVPQMQQMVELGRGRFSEDTTKARSEARYMGSSDDGPDRVPSKSTINFYLARANGDAAKAKQLAAEDGWTVK